MSEDESGPNHEVPSLGRTASVHEAEILAHVDRLPVLADMVVGGTNDAFRTAFDEECQFMTLQLIPHIEAVEAGLYPPLEQVMGTLHSLQPMRDEHRQLERLAQTLCVFHAEVQAGDLGISEITELRRTLYRLYALLRTHLGEERLFVRVLEEGLPIEESSPLAMALRHGTIEPSAAS